MQGSFLVLLAAACFGLSNVLGRMGIERSSAYVSVTWNVIVNACVFAAALVVTFLTQPDLVVSLNRDALPYFIGAGLLIDFAGRSAQYASAARLGASRASAFRVVAPLVTVFLGLILLGETLSFTSLIGVGAMLIGIAIVTRDVSRIGGATTRAETAAASEGGDGGAARLGVLYGALAALVYGFGDVARKQGISIEPFAIAGAAVSSWIGLALYAAVGMKTGRWREVVRPGAALPYVVASGVFTSAAVFFFLGGMRTIPVSLATPINGTQALFAIAFGWILNRRAERITVGLVAGSLLAVVGLGIVMRG